MSSGASSSGRHSRSGDQVREAAVTDGQPDEAIVHSLALKSLDGTSSVLASLIIRRYPMHHGENRRAFCCASTSTLLSQGGGDLDGGWAIFLSPKRPLVAICKPSHNNAYLVLGILRGILEAQSVIHLHTFDRYPRGMDPPGSYLVALKDRHVGAQDMQTQASGFQT
ncbi:hypothetical protein NM208_g11658 [Fusarium decemcellulare]|uniref:Uncharacterized protein n=1 Tax=Fusarium decemcellulare TaxID=57161 RepID=A0ACC1RTL7_9HYPO|nr:hypothetical protein NM208_g11658 [Fusarium decemcellulare]